MQSEVAFIAERNAAAADDAALSERCEEALTVHRFNLPATLRGTRQSTNAIENVMRNGREQNGNVKRRAASSLLWAASGFRHIRDHEDRSHLRDIPS
jgi:hypothetical protein